MGNLIEKVYDKVMRNNAFLFGCFLKFSIFLLLTVNCDSRKQEEYVYKIQVDTVKINIPSNFLDYYINFDILDDQNLFVGYSHFDHSLQFIDLKNREALHTIELASDGPDKIKTVSELFVTDEKIYIKAMPEWIIIDHKGQVLERFNYSDLARNFENKYVFDVGFTISYLQKKELSPDHNSVFMRLFPTTANINSSEIYEHPLFCKLDFQEKTIKIEPYLPYPEIFKSGINYGVLDKPSIIELEDRLIYSFPNHSAIYIYNFIDSTINSHEVRSTKIKSVIEVNQKGSLRDVTKSSFAGDRYHPLHYDQFRDLYYRVIRVKNDVQDVNEYFLQIVDNQFKIIDELLLPSEKAYQNRFKVTKEGAYFQLMSSRSSIFSYMYINVQAEKQ